MTSPTLLDLFCGAGGAAMGYRQAGFGRIVGVDNKPQPNYPFEFVLADAMTFPLEGFGLIHASPPCQAYSITKSIHEDRGHPRLIAPTLARLEDSGTPYILENVMPSRAKERGLKWAGWLCGAMFDLRMYRHRLFASNWLWLPPVHRRHRVRCAKLGYAPKDDEFWIIAGHVSNVRGACSAMGTPWMNQSEVAQAIPPAYTRYIGTQALEYLRRD